MAKYLKPDSELGFVEDSAKIEYLKFNNMRHTILGFMLGDFNNKGEYIIAPEIVTELISMRKFIVDSVDNMEVCHSELKLDKQLTFLVTYEGNRACLSLVEQIRFEGNFRLNSGAYSNINEYVLDEVETAGEIDRNLLYRRWNISAFGGAVLDVFNMDEATLANYFGLVNRFKYLMLANTALLNKEAEIEEIEAEYAVNVINSLKNYPKLKAVVGEAVKTQMEEKKGIIRLDKANFVKTFNEILTTTVENNLNVLTEQEKQELDGDLRNINRDYAIKSRQNLDLKTEKPPVKAHENAEEEEANTITQIDVGDYSNKSLEEIKTDFNESYKNAETRLYARAIDLLTPKEKKSEENDNVLFLLEYLISAGVKTANIVSEAIITEVETAKAPVQETVASTATAPKNRASAPKSQPKVKPAKGTGIGFVKPSNYKLPKQKSANSTPSSTNGRKNFVTQTYDRNEMREEQKEKEFAKAPMQTETSTETQKAKAPKKKELKEVKFNLNDSIVADDNVRLNGGNVNSNIDEMNLI